MITHLRNYKADLLLTGKLFLAALVLVSCASNPLNTDDALRDTGINADGFEFSLSDGEQITPEWWRNFDDPKLVDLVETALSQNRNISTAEANLAAADAVIRAARLGGSVGTNTSSNTELGQFVGSAENFETNFSANVGASWEFDAFGRIRSQVAAAEFNRSALLHVKRDIAVLVASQTAQAYVDLRGGHARYAVAVHNAKLQNEALSLIKDLVANGQSSDLDLYRSQAQYRTTLASLPSFRAETQVAAAQLSALTGLPIQTILRDYSDTTDFKVPGHRGQIVSGSATDLINRRPDIRQALNDVSAQLALTDFERSRLYPRLTFNANFDAVFNGGNILSQFGNFGYGIGPTVSWEGPDLRAVLADIKASDALADAAFFAYEQTILDALADVEARLASYARELERRSDLRQASAAARNALELANLRYEEGVDDFLDVLDAQRTLLDAEDDETLNNILITSQAIDAYRALGGMWTDDELNAARGTPVLQKN